MFIVDLAYVAPLETVDAHLGAHVAFLKEQYEKGVFIASGRKEPRTGGVIIARCSSAGELQAVLNKDPFKRNGVAWYTVTEFVPSMTAKGLEALMA